MIVIMGTIGIFGVLGCAAKYFECRYQRELIKLYKDIKEIDARLIARGQKIIAIQDRIIKIDDILLGRRYNDN